MSTGSVLTAKANPETARAEARFAFGKNWQRLLAYLTEERIGRAENSLGSLLGTRSLNGKSFLDVGCGSGLFSLAAKRLGAERVHSFDFDPQSVACAHELKRRYFDADGSWTIDQGSVLDPEFLSRLGQFDVVYSWGVLHHTGDMWAGLDNVTVLVPEGGKLVIALYNDQGTLSRVWRVVKKLYNKSAVWRWIIVPVFASYFAIRGFLEDVVVRRKSPLARYREFKETRGMAYFTDLLDWLGGYPFEVAKADTVCDFFQRRGFRVREIRSLGRGSGNNEFVFERCAG